MAVAGGVRPTQIVRWSPMDRTLTQVRIEQAQGRLCYDLADAVPLLLAGTAVRVDAHVSTFWRLQTMCAEATDATPRQD